MTPFHHWTYENVQQLPEDGNRYEVIDGVLYVSPPPLTIHQLLSRRLLFFFYALELEGKGFVYNAPTDLRMQGCDPVHPDLLYLKASQRSQIKDKWVEGPPFLLVEILSPHSRSRDRVKKLRKYASNQVPYYLLLDPEGETLEVLHLEGDSYRVEASLEPGDLWQFEGHQLDLKVLFAPLPPVDETDPS
jgi:Uma2 family endonuclease